MTGKASGPVDVFCAGTVFFDVILTGLRGFPALGTEVRAPGMGSSPGGIANLAVALSRLGLSTSLAAMFGTDAYGDYCWEVLSAHEGVDLERSLRFPGWHSPVTVSLVVDGERTMVTHAHDGPVPLDTAIGRPPRARAYFVHLGTEEQNWLRFARESGGLVFADIGWELSAACREQALDQLRHCDVFLPNRDEALALTGQRTVEAALRELLRHVPLVAITCGADGVVAADRASGEVVSVPALPVEAIDTTGAGDVFAAAFVLGTLSGWTPAERVRFATLCASLSVRQFGGSLAAPGWHDIATWWREADEELRQDYAFVAGLLPSHRLVPVRRASATLAAVSKRG
ncbi:carbohydrate kinase family protein [Amycolatopsis thermoflava]|uniref:carbohydrate kinase family protein n=1 Tax=Amycolatopsis thermoflava TaxID=84480 RepID=UPI003EBF9889